MKPRIVLVTGGRDFTDIGYVCWQLTTQHELEPFDLLVHGGARGVDTYAEIWANKVGVHTAVVKALWEYYKRKGRAKLAGHVRNGVMLYIPIDTVFAFPGGRGTADMLEQSQLAQQLRQPAMRIMDFAEDYSRTRKLLDALEGGRNDASRAG